MGGEHEFDSHYRVYARVAQLVRVTASYAVGQEFDPLLWHQAVKNKCRYY